MALCHVLAMFSAYRDIWRGCAFGHWTDGAAEDAALNHAFQALQDVLDRCAEQDMRTEDTMAVLDALEGTGRAKGWCSQFRRALDCDTPHGRWQNVNAALNGLRRQFGR
ncbi:MAG: hypothetical protein AAF296_02940 [Pseudomonadota bacterium]